MASVKAKAMAPGTVGSALIARKVGGAPTKASIAAWQRKYNEGKAPADRIQVDGVVGEQTLTAMGARAPAGGTNQMNTGRQASASRPGTGKWGGSVRATPPKPPSGGAGVTIKPESTGQKEADARARATQQTGQRSGSAYEAALAAERKKRGLTGTPQYGGPSGGVSITKPQQSTAQKEADAVAAAQRVARSGPAYQAALAKERSKRGLTGAAPTPPTGQTHLSVPTQTDKQKEADARARATTVTGQRSGPKYEAQLKIERAKRGLT